MDNITPNKGAETMTKEITWRETLIVKAIKVNGGWTLEASNGDRPTEGRVVVSRAQAYRDCEALYPANSAWQGHKVPGGYCIRVS
jgi:hypothetical protein